MLQFGQRFIGVLGAVGAVGGVAGALAYPLLSRRMRLRRLINLAIELGVAGTLAYLAYGNPVTALAIEATSPPPNGHTLRRDFALAGGFAARSGPDHMRALGHYLRPRHPPAHRNLANTYG